MIVVLILASGLASAANGGGSVNNTVPEVLSTDSGPSPVNVGTTEVIEGVVKDKNREADMQMIKVYTVGGPSVSSELTVPGTIPATEPATFTSNWKIWDLTANDGQLSFKFQHTYATTGTYTWRVSVQDEITTYQFDAALDLIVEVRQAITVAANPVNSAGTAQVAAAWGGWAEEPGAANVNSSNYLRIQNTGANATQAVAIDFSNVTFLGVDDDNEEINIDNNIQFAYIEVDDGEVPTQGTQSGWSATSGAGVANLAFSTGNVIYVTYRIVLIPEPLMDQVYQASYTVNAVV